jgi:hypothetical protein
VDDIVKRLHSRSLSEESEGRVVTADLIQIAADEIDRLRRERETMCAALNKVVRGITQHRDTYTLKDAFADAASGLVI